MSAPIQQAIEGLERIVRWDELSSEFKMNYGSNGERDHFRGVASDALSALQSLQGVELPPLLPSDHPAPHTLVWSKVEIEAIQAYARAAVAAALARGVVPSGWQEALKLKMEWSAWDGTLQLGDALANIDEVARQFPAAPTPEATQPIPVANTRPLKEAIADLREQSPAVADAMDKLKATQSTQAEAPSEREALTRIERELIEGVLRGAVGFYGMAGTPALSNQAREALEVFRRAALATQQAGQGWPLDCNPKCAVSWSGFNVYGDEKSIKEVNRLMHMDGRAADLQRILESERALRATPHAPQQPEALAQQERDREDAVLAYLDALQDDAIAHIWPDDLKKCQTSECVVEVASVRLGSPSGKTLPLFSRDQVREAIRAARSSEGGQS